MDEIQERLAASSRAAAAEIAALRAGNMADREFLLAHLKKYLQARLELPAPPEEGGPLNQAIGQSVARTMKVDLSLLTQVDVPAGCTAATAVMSKRILLFIALQNELDFKFSVEATARIRTVGDLAEQIWLGKGGGK